MLQEIIESFVIAFVFYLIFYLPARFLIKEPALTKIGRKKK